MRSLTHGLLINEGDEQDTQCEARDLDHALEIARLSPATRRGGVEVRPLLG